MLLCPADVAHELGVSRALVAVWIREGKMRVTRDTRGWAWVERRELERVRRLRLRKRRKAITPKFAQEANE